MTVQYNHIPINDNLLQILDNYISDGLSKKEIEYPSYQARLRKLRFSSDQITEILIAMDHEIEKEKIARTQDGKSGLILFSGIALTTVCILLIVLSLLRIISYAYLNRTVIGGAVFAILTILKGIHVINDRKRRASIRHVMWKGRFD